MIIENSNKLQLSVCEASYWEMILALSYSYFMARYNDTNLEVDILWSRYFVDNNFYYLNWDEVESSVEKFNYLHSMIEFKSNNTVKFNHVLLDDGVILPEHKLPIGDIHNNLGYMKFKAATNKQYRELHKSLSIMVQDDISNIDNRGLLWPLKNKLTRKRKKVTFWRPTFIHKIIGETSDISWPVSHKKYRGWLYRYSEWNQILKNLKENYDVVEIEYRTPIREVYYHLSTSEFAVGYAGICQNFSCMLSTPTILISSKPFKSSINLGFDHLLSGIKPDFYKDINFIEDEVNKAKHKISKFRDYYKNFFGE